MITTKQRTVFNLGEFVVDLEGSLGLSDNVKDAFELDYVEDVVDRLKKFVDHSSPEVVKASYKYLMNHPIVLENTTVMSFIESCFD